jgi:hypothetical protein
MRETEHASTIRRHLGPRHDANEQGQRAVAHKLGALAMNDTRRAGRESGHQDSDCGYRTGNRFDGASDVLNRSFYFG